MQNKSAIIIFTRDRPYKLIQALQSINNVDYPIVIIDDSVKEMKEQGKDQKQEKDLKEEVTQDVKKSAKQKINEDIETPKKRPRVKRGCPSKKEICVFREARDEKNQCKSR